MPRVFTDKQIDTLIDKLGEGNPLTEVCKDSEMPSVSSVYSWVESDPDFSGRFHAARARGVHALAEGCLAIADEKAKDAVEVADKRLRIDTRLRLAGKWLSKHYGDKVIVDKNTTVTHQYDLDSLDDIELEKLEVILANAQRSAGSEGAEKPTSVH